ncbi:MAG: NAD synthetase, partial [Rhodospirillales bacterium]|nr:NAD synthetase [Rhodospirillales bacterium]
MTSTTTGFAYLIASVCFILALRGLSNPESSRKGNFLGITGMVIAVLTTLMDPGVVSFSMIILGVLIGGSIGTVVALKIKMTSLPELVAAFHSLVGLAAVFVAAAAFSNPEAFGLGKVGEIGTASLIEMSLGTAIGAITFSGSIIAFAKLQGVMSGAPIVFAGQHKLNAALGIALVIAIISLAAAESPGGFWTVAILAFVIGFMIIIPIGGADMPVVVSMLNSYSGWAACGIGFTLSNVSLIVTGALVGSSGAILSYIMCKGMNRSIFNVMLGGFGTDDAGAAAAGGGGDRSVKS